MRKGVSAIIATVLLLMITIALAGTAYIYMTGMIGGKTSKTISILDGSCSSNIISVVLSNDGTETIDGTEGTGDIKIYVNNIPDNTFSFTPVNIAPHSTGVVTDINGNAGANTVLVVSPSNAIRQVVYC